MVRATSGLPLRPNTPSQGAQVGSEGVCYCTWSEHPHAAVIIYKPDRSIARSVTMEHGPNGYLTAKDPQGGPGDLYKYRFGESDALPDPASRYQPFGVHGPSMVVANAFKWTDHTWKPPLLESVILYELHVGTFTAAGTFASAVEKIPYLADLGINAIEIMPVADFPGQRNWGYDGVCLYAPARVYGPPDDFRWLVNSAHHHGVAIILDVVYNHFGPDGNYLAAYHADYFHPKHKTPWGSAFHFEQPSVRQFFLQNIAYWMDEFHIDGFRLDATHAIVDSSPTHILAEIADVVHERGGFVIAEDERNDPALVTAAENGGLGLDGCWADDFHHVVTVMTTANRDGYFGNYQGTGDELAATLQQGWLFTGQVQPTTGRPRGADPSSLRPAQFIYCISNHDQVGNRAFGERLRHLVSPATYRAASALLLLSPYTPLLFMGQEWGADTPFQYFTDHNAELGRKIIAGRRREFRDFAAFRDAEVRETIPSPQAEDTFHRSKLNWSELDDPAKQKLLALYRRCLTLRNKVPSIQNRSRQNWRVVQMAKHAVAIVYGFSNHERSILIADLMGAGFSTTELSKFCGVEGRFETLFTSNDEEFRSESHDGATEPQTVLLRGWARE